jgi:predicted ArsR family transcriptional regulator
MSDATISSAELRILKLLVGNPPKSIPELAEEMEVTRTAVTEQLHELIRVGFVDRTKKHISGRGRPRYLFAATDSALLFLFASHHQLLVPSIWKAIGEVGGEALVPKVMQRVSRILADHYIQRITAAEPEKRLRQLVDILTEEGGLFKIVKEHGKTVVYKRGCTYVGMFDKKRLICRVDMDMMSQVVGRPLRCLANRHDGQPCCSFEIAEEKGGQGMGNR